MPPVITEDTIELLQLHDLNVSQARRALELAEERRETVRARLRASLPSGEAVDIGGRFRLKRTKNLGQRTFSLTTYEETYGKLTQRIEAIAGRAKGSESWKIEELET